MVYPVLFYYIIASMTERKPPLAYCSDYTCISPFAAKTFGQGNENCDPQQFQLYYLPKS